jgi:hypothetical protein
VVSHPDRRSAAIRLGGVQEGRDLQAAVAALLSFLELPLTQTVADLEQELAGKQRDGVERILDEHGIDGGLLGAALLARNRFGRINDVIHAAAIVLLLPDLLEPGEILKRPSLAAGNDPTRPFDLETDRRVAEFKLARWRGADAMRKRHVFKDLVHLAAESSDRSKQLFVLGAEPIHFLTTTESTARWGLDRFPAAREAFAESFGAFDVAISDFVADAAVGVEIVDLEQRWPTLFRL